MSKVYKLKNVLEATRERINYLFDNFENISVSVSGGKDSSVLFDLTYKEAEKRERKIEVVFIDQEAEYEATIDVVRYIASKPLVNMKWYQVPFLMTNSTCYSEDYLHCWDGGEYRKKEDNSIQDYFEKDLTWESLLVKLEKSYNETTACLIGLRSSESLNRYRAVVKNPAFDNIKWSSKTTNDKCINFYPIYDWEFCDIWKYIWEEQIFYNKIYDFQFMKKYNSRNMRVSCLIHDKAMNCLADLQEFEPQTFEWLCKRCNGVDTAARYVKENQMYSATTLPSGYENWQDFRDFLLKNHHNDFQKNKFIKRFSNMPNNELVAQQQVASLLINDWEFLNQIDEEKEEKFKQKKQQWLSIL